MFTKTPAITSTLLAAAALVTCGCSAARMNRTPMVESRDDATVVASAHQAAPDNDRRTARVDDTRMGIPQHDRVSALYSETEPPLLRMETPVRSLNNEEFWVGGHWMFLANNFSWQAGRIESDRPGELFCPAGWARSSRGWEYSPERWR